MRFGWFWGCSLLWLSLWLPWIGAAASDRPSTELSSSVLPVTQVYGRFIHLNRDHPQLSQTTALVQDQQGFLWFGTQHGLYRYDGHQLESFRADPTNPNSLSADWISSLLVDKQGLLWVGTRYGGLNRFDPATEQFRRLPLPRDQGAVQQVEISVLYQDPQLRIWVGTFGAGLYRWLPTEQRLEEVALPSAAQQIDAQFINALHLDAEGFLWLGSGNAPLRSRGQSEGGALRWHPERLESHVFSVKNAAVTAGSVTAIKPDRHGKIWLTSYGSGLWQFDATQQRLIAAPAQPAALQKSLLTDLWFGPDGALWLSSYDDGLWLLPKSGLAWQQFRANPALKQHLSSNNLTGLLLDQQQNLWLKSPAGIFAFGAMAQQVRSIGADLNNPTMLAHPDVFGIAKKAPGQFWLANRDGGLAEVDLHTGLVKRWPIQTAATVVQKPTLLRHVIQDVTGKVWLGTDAGLFWLDQQTGDWQLQPLLAGAVQPHIGVLLLDQKQQLWIGSRGDGLFRLNAAGVTQYRHDLASDVGLASDTISTLQTDYLDDVWIGYADQGLSRLDQLTGKIQSWREGTANAAGLTFNGIQLIYRQEQLLWVRAGGVNHRVIRDPRQPKTIVAFKPYLNAVDYDVELQHANHFLWLYRNRLEDKELVLYGEPHGFQGTTWIGSWLVTAEGMHLRGGNQGVDYYWPLQLPKQTTPLQARFTAFSLFNKKVKPDVDSEQPLLEKAIGYADHIWLQYQQDMFSLHFSALEFVEPSQIRYRYRLVGFDRDWIETDASSRVATYTRLAPGNYQFEVMARRPGQQWSQVPVSSVKLSVQPPWWLTFWAKSLAVLALAVAIWLFLQFRLRNERQNRNRLEQLVNARTTELQTQHQALTDAYRDMTLLQMLAKQITASLDLQEIIYLCQQSLNQIMDVHVLAIGIYQPDRQVLQFSHWLENGQYMASFELNLQPELHLASVCFNQQREVNIRQREEFLHYLTVIPAPVCGAPMQSVLYFPLTVNSEKIGCLSLQSPTRQAFSPQQINLVRTLASNIAIAVANANIVARLQQTQQQLVMQEKMASLGGLVAGVAHEVNTPLGICVTAASHLQMELQALQQAHQQKTLGALGFQHFLETALAATEILTANTQRAAQLINSFKQVAVDKTAVSQREFELTSYLQEVLHSLQPELNRKQCHFSLHSPPGILLHTDAGALAQLLTHLVMNSLQHGFVDATANAEISLEVSSSAGQVLLEYRDNGVGMNSDTLKRLFDPFFTTKRSDGHSGLGAHIVYNLVTAQLHGTIYVSSEVGQGVHYRILLPLQRRPD